MNEESRWDEIKVGAFVLAALAILIVGSLWVAGSTVFHRRMIPYRVLMKNSGGIKAGDHVRIAGVDVGRVREVSLRPGEDWPVAFQVVLDAGITPRQDSTARIATAGLLGSSFLQIDPGTPQAPPLPPAGDILGLETFGLEESLVRLDQVSAQAVALMNQVAGILDQLSKDARPILTNLEGFLSPENSEHLGVILASLDNTLEESGPALSSLVAHLDSISKQLDADLESLRPLADHVSGLAAGAEAAIGPDGARLARVLEAAEKSLSSAGSVISTIDGHKQDLDTAMRDLQTTAANLKAFSQLLKERPFSLVRIKPEPERRPGQGLVRGSP